MAFRIRSIYLKWSCFSDSSCFHRKKKYKSLKKVFISKSIQYIYIYKNIDIVTDQRRIREEILYDCTTAVLALSLLVNAA